MALLELVNAINVAAGTTGLSFNAACNAYAGTTGREGQDALNVAAGTDGLELPAVLNVLAGTDGLEAQHAANLLPPAGGGTVVYSYGWEPAGTGGWSASSGGTLLRSTSQFHSGVASLRLTPPTGTAPYAYDSTTQPVSASTSYTYTAWVWRPAVDDVQLAIEWFDAGFGSLSVSSGASTPILATTWTQLTFTTTSPALAANASVRVVLPGAASSTELLYIDDVVLETP